MRRILIANNDAVLNEELKKQLGKRVYIRIIPTDENIVQYVNDTDPDVLVIDLQTCPPETAKILRTIRLACNNIAIVVLASRLSKESKRELEGMFGRVLLKPVTAVYIAEIIRLELKALRARKSESQYIVGEIEQLLRDLYFTEGKEQYTVTKNAILARMMYPEGVLMKTIYLDIKTLMHTKSENVEKTLRDAIKSAWTRGDRSCWNMYFRPVKHSEERHPTNEEFLARIASCLKKEGRLHRPIEQSVIAK
ncbi:MAG: hypothetical protein J6Q54_02745 [Oscillospiraceae bacterium]|nr:hypothetical protein [Oscillospiraceae bacterium]